MILQLSTMLENMLSTATKEQILDQAIENLKQKLLKGGTVPEFQATGNKCVIDRVVTSDKEVATKLFKKNITAARFPFLYKMWKENDFAVKESKNPRMPDNTQGRSELKSFPSFTS